jgi:hypothetical protein
MWLAELFGTWLPTPRATHAGYSIGRVYVQADWSSQPIEALTFMSSWDVRLPASLPPPCEYVHQQSSLPSTMHCPSTTATECLPISRTSH